MSERSSFAAWLTQGHGEFCPDCDRPVSIWSRTCFGPDPHNTYHCSWCSWTGRSPVGGVPCLNEWPAYEPRWPVDLAHPIVCSCSGRGFYPPDQAPPVPA